MTAVKYVLGVFAVLFLIVVGCLFALSTVDLSNHKDRIAALIEDNTSWQVKSFDDIHFVFGISPTLELKDFELVQTDDTQIVDRIYLGDFSIEVDIWDYITNSFIHIKRFHLDNGDLAIRSKQLIKQVDVEEIVEEEQVKSLLARIPDLYLAKLRILRSKVVYLQQKVEENIVANLDDIEIASPANGKELGIRGEGDIADLDFLVGGSFGALSRYIDKTGQYPFELTGSMANQAIKIEGYLEKEMKDDRLISLNIDISGNRIVELMSAFNLPRYDIPDYEVLAKAQVSQSTASISDIAITLGYSHFYGIAKLDFGKKTPYVFADLNASKVRVADFSAFLPKKTEDLALAENANPSEETEEKKPLFSNEPIALDALKAVNGRIDLAVASIEGEPIEKVMNEVHVEASLNDGNIVLSKFNASNSEGGKLKATAELKNQNQLIDINSDLEVRNFSLTPLTSILINDTPIGSDDEIIKGRLNSRVRLKSSGSSPDELAANLSGTIRAAMNDGAITATALEGLGLDLTEAVTSFMADNPMTDIRCLLVDYPVQNGVVSMDHLLLSTKDTNVRTRGQINLDNETIDLTLETKAKDFSLIAGQSPLGITGDLKSPDIELIRTELVARGAASIAAGLINPVLAVLPLMELGLGDDNACKSFSGELRTFANR